IPNSDQADEDGDGIGDACDPDSDGDGWIDDTSVAGGGCGCSTSDASSPAAAGVLLLLIGLALLRPVQQSGRRRLGGRLPVAARALVLVTVWLAAAPAEAQEGGFPAQRLHPPIDAEGIGIAESGEVAEEGSWTAAMWFNYSRRPLVLYDPDGEVLGALVANRADTDVIGSYAVLPWLEVGVQAKLAFQGRPSEIPAATDGLGPLQGAGFGDLRLASKAKVLDSDIHRVDGAFLLNIGLPTGASDHYYGEGGFTLRPEIAISRELAQGFTVAANLGYLLRPRSEILDLVIDDELVYAFSAAFDFRRGGLEQPVRVAMAFIGALPAAAPVQANTVPLEFMGMGSWTFASGIEAFGGLGAGLTRGWATPSIRILLGLRYGGQARWRPEPTGDHLADSSDAGTSEPVSAPADTSR
ncbi:MAG: transporter, partial [Myxococcota bacterium]